MQVVFERQESYDMHGGPHGYERVGFEHDGRVFWVGCNGSYMGNNAQYSEDKRFCEELVRRFNDAPVTAAAMEAK